MLGEPTEKQKQSLTWIYDSPDWQILNGKNNNPKTNWNKLQSMSKELRSVAEM